MKFEIAELSKQDFDSCRDNFVASSIHSNVNSLNEFVLIGKNENSLTEFSGFECIQCGHFYIHRIFLKGA